MHPTFAPYTTPNYSNGGYEILAFALEAITNRSFAQMVERDLFSRLGMNSSSFAAPADLSNGVIPGGAETSGFSADIGNATA